MKNITLSADEHLIERARQTALSENKTLNTAFREWLEQYTQNNGDAEEYDRIMARLRGRVVAGRKFTREEMNER
ncbi:MAG TPA: hypothetical protein VGS78_06400 [Candidatus Sulfotelmatobacter sp.]|nr:hypothetical protein [Candidatus Sulfotelmatobacter sp.]